MKVWIITGQDVQDPYACAEDNLSFLNEYEEEDWEYNTAKTYYEAGDGWTIARLTTVEES
jgi:hypothetical protein